MATKPLVTANLTLHGGIEVTIADYIDNSGMFVPIGHNAQTAVGDKIQIHYKDAEGVETIIPYHAIDAAEFTWTETEVTVPDDDFCQADDGGSNSAVVGTAVVGTDVVSEP